MRLLLTLAKFNETRLVQTGFSYYSRASKLTYKFKLSKEELTELRNGSSVEVEIDAVNSPQLFNPKSYYTLRKSYKSKR